MQNCRIRFEEADVRGAKRCRYTGENENCDDADENKDDFPPNEFFIFRLYFRVFCFRYRFVIIGHFPFCSACKGRIHKKAILIYVKVQTFVESVQIFLMDCFGV